MPYRAIQKDNQFQLYETDASGIAVKNIGTAPDKVALQTLVTQVVIAKKSPPKTIEFDDNGVITKDDTVLPKL